MFVEVDEDTTAYDAGHIEGAVKLDWKADLQDPVRRDFVNRDQFSELLSGRGISNDDTAILYGGRSDRAGRRELTAPNTIRHSA